MSEDLENARRRAEETNKPPVYVALFGQPGAGKSSLINAIAGERLAEVGVENDVTVERTDYSWNGLFLSDLPGYGTTKFPAQTYAQRFELHKFDIFLCVTAGKLTDDDVRLFEYVHREGKHCIFVRNKIEAEFQDGICQKDLRERIRKNIRQQIGFNATVVLTSCRTREGLSDLVNAIEEALPGVKRDRFRRAAAIYSLEFLERKKAACRAYARYAAGVSAAANMIPVPGLGFAIDVTTILSAMAAIRADFGLSKARMDSFAAWMPAAAPAINSLLNYATGEGAVLLCKQIAPRLTLAEVSKFLPGFGTVVAATVSYAATWLVLTFYIDDCFEVAKEMLEAHFQA